MPHIPNQNILFVVLLSFILPVVWVVKILRGHMPYVDLWTRGFVETVADTHIYSIARWITNFGSDFFLVPFTITVGIIIWFIYRDWLPALLFSGGTLVSHLTNMLLKVIVRRERPMIYIEANAEGFSFPSGHSMITMVCYGILMYLIIKKLHSRKHILIIQLFFSVFIFSIGISRYILNVHYLTDVISGFIIGFFLLYGLISLYEYVKKRRNIQATPS